MKSILVIAVALTSVFVTSLRVSVGDEIPRPHIIGLSHVALYVHDIAKTRAFYKDFLGFAEPYWINNPDHTLHLTWIKINDRQTIELFPEKQPNTDRLYHIALETDDAAGMRDYLAAHGVKVPDKVGKGKIGNYNYFITDPDGHIVEIVQYAQNGWTMLSKGKFLPDTRISNYMSHAGILVDDVDAAKNFYEGILGFKEISAGSKSRTQLSWVHERMPEGKEFLEFMLYSQLPDPDKRGKFHHFCLEVPDINAARATLEQRAASINYTKPMEIALGINRKRQLNVYDPDGTRVELMEPFTIDRLPTPSSTAPPPVHPSTQPAN